MAKLRHLGRHAHHTIVVEVTDWLQAGGWFAPVADDRPFSGPPITLRELDFETVEKVEPNTVSITHEDETTDDEYELGGVVWTRETRTFIDVYGASPTVARAIAEDCKDALTMKTLTVKDFTQDPPSDTSGRIIIERIQNERPPSSYGAIDFKRHWRALTITSTIVFEGIDPLWTP